ncbi:hypothetical protein F5B20DRAFT_377392 [Whalleya microplaca]|nr:hypothetical protein F5B20DRAFT_377392 [Whalleya microplaca]
MCFTEYIGYTCGHTSLPVKRPCPLTTQQHSHPSCPRSAARPILAPGMCPPCARILHFRHVNIVEFEHRFMHERGACGCPVRFPFLQHPRVVAPGGVMGHQNHNHNHNQGQSSGGGAGGGNKGNKGKGKKANNRGGGGAGGSGNASSSTSSSAAKKGQPKLPPLYEEEPQAGGNVGVAVRLPSVYGAEWNQEHAPLHQHDGPGNCNCEIRFDNYVSPYMGWPAEQQQLLEGPATTNIASTAVGRIEGPAITNTTSSSIAVANTNTAIARIEGPAVLHPPIGPPALFIEPPADEYQQYPQQYPGGVPPRSDYPGWPPTPTPPPPGRPARWTFNAPRAGSAPAEAEQQRQRPLDMQTVWYEAGTEAVPMAGLPIGAGPEGDSHMPPFEDCELLYPPRQPGGPRPHSR